MNEVNNISVEQAAITYDKENFGWPQPGERVYMEEIKTREWNVEAFKAGAQWQKEQNKELLSVLKDVVSNLFYQIESKLGPEKAYNYPPIKRAKEAIEKFKSH